jgi:hypothetical protein
MQVLGKKNKRGVGEEKRGRLRLVLGCPLYPIRKSTPRIPNLKRSGYNKGAWRNEVKMRKERGAIKLHWTTWSVLGLVVIAAITAIAAYLPTLSKPPAVRAADEFLLMLSEARPEEAAKMLSETAPVERNDLIEAWGQKLSSWGGIERIELFGVFEAPTDLKHPKAKQAVRVDYTIIGELSRSGASVYLVPEGNNWRVVSYYFE